MSSAIKQIKYKMNAKRFSKPFNELMKSPSYLLSVDGEALKKEIEQLKENLRISENNLKDIQNILKIERKENKKLLNIVKNLTKKDKETSSGNMKEAATISLM